MAAQNGPRAGRGQGRHRNTVANNNSKKSTNGGYGGATFNPGGGPPVGAQSAVGYAGQYAQLQQSLYARLANLKAQKGLLKSNFIQNKADIRTGLREGVVAAEGDALSRGIVGSSADSSARAGVFGEAASARVRNRNEFTAGKLGLASERIDATNEYYTGMFQVQAAQRAEQMAEANAALERDLAYATSQAQIQASHELAMYGISLTNSQADALKSYVHFLKQKGASNAEVTQAVHDQVALLHPGGPGSGPGGTGGVTHRLGGPSGS